MDILVTICFLMAIGTFAIFLLRTLQTRRNDRERRARIMSRYRE